MILEVSANHDSFRPVRLTSGLNTILADRIENSSKRDTRNGLGKSTLIEIIHLGLGSRVKKGRGLAIPDLSDWTFNMKLLLDREEIKVSRSLTNHNRIEVAGLSDKWTDIPPFGLLGIRLFQQPEWTSFLGTALFYISTNDAPKYNPSFRILISYFIRHGHHAYGKPFSFFPQQPTWSMQLHVDLMLGLEWRHAVQWQNLKDRAKELNTLKGLVETGSIPGIGGTIGEL